eukprot:scaffold245982_cov31-Tisochrysis_lutea.AAC.1
MALSLAIRIKEERSKEAGESPLEGASRPCASLTNVSTEPGAWSRHSPTSIEPAGWPDRDSSKITRSLVSYGLDGNGCAVCFHRPSVSRPPCVHAMSVGSHRRLPPQTSPGIALDVESEMPTVCAVALPSPAANASSVGTNGSQVSVGNTREASLLLIIGWLAPTRIGADAMQ